MDVRIAPELADIIALGVVAFDRAKVRERDDRLDVPLAEAAAAMREAGGSGDAVTAVREMYKRLGIDPTKTRPSSEALLRRVRKGEPLPRINTLVDVCNWCSLDLQLPYGLYDLDRITGAVELRRGRAGEEYPGIRKDIVHLDGRPVLADQNGAFGNPTSDSARTMVTPRTQRALFVIYAPRAARSRLDPALDLTSRRVIAFTGAREIARHAI